MGIMEKIIFLLDYHLKYFKGENMKKFLLFAIFILLGLIVFSENKNDYVKGEIIIKLKNLNSTYSLNKNSKGIIETKIEEIDKINSKYNVRIIEKVFRNVTKHTTKQYSKIKKKYVEVPDLFSIFLIKYNEKVDPEIVAKEYSKLKNVEWAEPNYKFQLTMATTDPAFILGKQWGVFMIDAPDGWDIERGSQDVIVAVIDSGLDYNHPDLKNNIWKNSREIEANGIDDDGNGYVDDIMGWDFVDNDNDPKDEHGYGTHCAGIITGIHGRCFTSFTCDCGLSLLSTPESIREMS